MVDHDTTQFGILTDDGTDTSVLAGDHLAELLHLRLGIELGIGIKSTEHGIEAGVNHLAGIDSVDVHEVKVLASGVEDVHILAYGKNIGLLRRNRRKRAEGYKKKKEFFHIWNYVAPTGLLY